MDRDPDYLPADLSVGMFLEHCQHPMAMLDRDLRYLHVTRGWKEIYDLGDRDVTGLRHDEIVDLPAEWIAQYRRCLDGETLTGPEEQLPGDFEPPEFVKRTLRPWRGADGEIGGVIIEKQRVTEERRAREALEVESALSDAVLEHVEDGIVACDAEGNLTLFNAAARRFHGVDSEPIPPSEWASRYDLFEADGETPLAMESVPLFRALKGEQVRKAEMMIIARGQAPRRLVANASQLKDQQGNVIGAMASMHDVTEQQQAEEKQAAAEAAAARHAAELELIFDHIPVSIFFKDDKNRILRLNKAAADSMGMTVEEATGVDTYELFPEMAAKYHEDDLEVINSGKPKLNIIERYTPAGALNRWNSTDKVPYTDAETGERFVFVAAVDVTERKNAQDRLQAREETYRRFYNETPAMLQSFSLEGILLSVSDYWLSTLGYTREEVIGRNVMEFMTPESAEFANRVLARQMVNGESIDDIELRLRRSDGSELDVLVSAIAEYDANDRIQSVLAVTTDITERKAVERSFLRAQKMDSVGQLTGGLAHDLNNILGVVMGNLELLRRMLKEDSKGLKRVDNALSAAERGAALNRRLLAFARRQHLEPEVLAPEPLLRGMSELIGRVLSETIEFRLEVPEHMPLVKVDPAQLESAILNLSMNARDAMPEGGELVIESSVETLKQQEPDLLGDPQPGPYLVISVSDTGHGIPKDIRDSVFEPFFTTKDSGAGTGLGLSMVYGFAKQSGGGVRVHSEEQAGTTVRLYLPLSDTGIDGSPLPPTDKAEHKRGREKVLVVEDQPDLRETAVELVSSLGYEVVSAGSGDEALALAESGESFDLLFTDVVMPGQLDGVELAERLRDIHPDLPVVFTSGYAQRAILDNDDRARQTLIMKPYGVDALAGKLRQVIDEE